MFNDEEAMEWEVQTILELEYANMSVENCSSNGRIQLSIWTS